MVNQKLLVALQEKGWSIEVASARVGVSRVTFSRWVNGRQEPQPAVLALLCNAFGKSAGDLGYEHLSKEPAQPQADEKNVQISDASQNPLQMLTEEQSIAFASLLRLGESVMFDPTKRKTLEALVAAISMATVKPQGLLQPDSWKQLLSPGTDVGKTNEATLLGFEKLIDACWQLSLGHELRLTEELLPTCMTKLVPIAQQPSKHQQQAASLAAQGYQIYSVLALHRNDLVAKELYSKQAVHYALLSGDRNILVISLRQLADAYRYNNQYPQMLQTYQNALQYIEEISPLFQSCMFSGLAIAYAHLDQRQNALTHLGFAIDAFPEHPNADPGYSFADFDQPWLILREGIIRTRLGQTKQALDTFKRIEQPGVVIPERIRLEIVNQQGKTAIIAGDLEQGATYIEAGVTGSRELGSQRRYNEAHSNFNQMSLLWPQEKRVKALGELFDK